MDQNSIIIVSGLPRSGTSMMMKMLEAGGMSILTDRIREADEDNPLGYYEFERVKQTEHDKTWLPEARGKAVKMVSALLKHLPPEYQYSILFMQRDMDEILASQKKMLLRRGEPTDSVSNERMAQVFEKHLAQMRAWLNHQPNAKTLFVNYDETVQDPMTQAQRVNEFLGGSLNIVEMAAVVDPKLHRQRH